MNPVSDSAGTTDQLLAEGAALDQESAPLPPVAPGTPAAPQVDPLQVARGVVNVTAAVAGMLWPFAPKHFTPAACDEIARAAVPLLVAYNVDLDALGGKVSLWFGFAGACMGPLSGFWADLKAQREAEKNVQGGKPAASGSSTAASDEAGSGGVQPLKARHQLDAEGGGRKK